MEKIRTRVICGLVVFGTFLLLLPSLGSGQTTVNCPGESLQAAIANALPNTTISVNGTCNENIIIGFDKTNLTLDGGGAATINGTNPIQATIRIQSKPAIIKGLNVIGSFYGILVEAGSTTVLNAPSEDMRMADSGLSMELVSIQPASPTTALSA